MNIKSYIGHKWTNRLLRIKYLPKNIMCSFYPLRDTIILESNPDLADNTYQLYLYMIENGLNQKLKIIWLVNNPEDYHGFPDNVCFAKKFPSTREEKKQHYIMCNRSKVIITCNHFIQKNVTNRKQLNIYLGHGALIKTLKDKNGFPDNCCSDYAITQSVFFTEILADNLGLEKNQIICTGYPRDDVFYREMKCNTSVIPDINSFSKTIIWMPTFRRMANSNRIDCDFVFPLGIPLLQSYNELLNLNKVLEENNILLIIKAHPAQDLSIIKNLDYNNIRFIPDKVLREHSIQTEELLTFSDALITDYSSVYYDYLLLNKPIAISLDDYNEYKKQHGIVFDDIKEVIKGVYLYTTDDLCRFIVDVAKGIDREKKGREAIRDLTNAYQDGKSSKRVYEFIMTKLSNRGLINND